MEREMVKLEGINLGAIHSLPICEQICDQAS